MPARGYNVLGLKFGKLTVVRLTGTTYRRKLWACKCECGGTRQVTASDLISGKVSHCGCERTARRVAHNFRHGGYGTRLYNIWHGMLQRCEYEKHTKYWLYGGRGITVCEDWHDFAKFRDWALAHGYADRLTLDREDGDKGYEPGNCRWVSYKVQNLNRRFWAAREGEGY